MCIVFFPSRDTCVITPRKKFDNMSLNLVYAGVIAQNIQPAKIFMKPQKTTRRSLKFFCFIRRRARSRRGILGIHQQNSSLTNLPGPKIQLAQKFTINWIKLHCGQIDGSKGRAEILIFSAQFKFASVTPICVGLKMKINNDIPPKFSWMSSDLATNRIFPVPQAIAAVGEIKIQNSPKQTSRNSTQLSNQQCRDRRRSFWRNLQTNN